MLPENVTPEPVTEEQLVEIEAIEAQEGESDLEYKESSSDDEEVAIASVK